jgi:hypothetical protein
MAYTYLRIELDDIDTSDLIEELDNRYLDNNEQDQLLDLIKESRLRTDAQKIKLFLKAMDKYSIQELQELFQENMSTIISKNQLQLSL